MQTENPCAILDQENAKLFLKGSPQDKYKFFLQSTDLYKMRTTYSKIDEETRSISESILKREKLKIAALQEAMEEATQAWEEAQSVSSMVPFRLNYCRRLTKICVDWQIGRRVYAAEEGVCVVLCS